MFNKEMYRSGLGLVEAKDPILYGGKLTASGGVPCVFQEFTSTGFNDVQF